MLAADVIYFRINVAVLTSDFNINICRTIVEEVSGEASNDNIFGVLEGCGLDLDLMCILEKNRCTEDAHNAPAALQGHGNASG